MMRASQANYNYDRDDPHFVKDLFESQRYADLAAAWLREKGYQAEVNPVRVRPDASQMAAYADNGDIVCTGRFNGIEQSVRIEAKHRKGLGFTCANDYPFPTAIVDVAHHWDKANPKPFAYLIFNEMTTHLMVIYGSASKNWIRKERFDTKKGRNRVFLECPLVHCHFRKVSEQLT